ncbi:MAG: DNA gyrase inhibitor YacG [Kofleriaceae bacterium]
MKCPTCKAVVHKAGGNAKLLPFCSERCQLVDLGQWLGETYRVPGEPIDDSNKPPTED